MFFPASSPAQVTHRTVGATDQGAIVAADLLSTCRISPDGLAQVSLSRDKQMIAVVRHSHPWPNVSKTIELYQNMPPACRQFFQIDGPIVAGGFTMQIYGNVRWSHDNRSLFFEGYMGDTYAHLFRYDVSETAIKPIAVVVGCSEVISGQYQGNLVCALRKHTLVRVWNWYWLLDINGKELAAIGDEGDLDMFVSHNPVDPPLIRRLAK